MKTSKLLVLFLIISMLFCGCASSAAGSATGGDITEAELNEETFLEDLLAGVEARMADAAGMSNDLQDYIDNVNIELGYLGKYEDVTFDDSYYENIRATYMEALNTQMELLQNSSEEDFLQGEDGQAWDDTLATRYSIYIELYERHSVEFSENLICKARNYLAVYDYGYDEFYEDLNDSLKQVEDAASDSDHTTLIKITNPLSVEFTHPEIYLSLYGLIGEGDDADYEYLGEVNIESFESWQPGEEITFRLNQEQYDLLAADYENVMLYVIWVDTWEE